ncbi:MAG: DUF1801 domain-containing protein [Thiolinea sp.]
MQIQADNFAEYIAAIPEARREALQQLYTTISQHIPAGFTATMQYNMPGFVVPHTLYPDGYHCKPSDPLPFINIASQKHFIALYHMGIYADTELLEWFVAEYPKHCSRKLDMGKSCIRFRNINQIPYTLIAELVEKMTVNEWIALYEHSRKPAQKS